MGKQNLEGFFRNANVPAAAREQIVARFQKKTILKNQFQLNAGKVCDEYLFLERGHLRAFAYDTNANEVTTGFYATGQIVFEVSSFFTRSRSKENIQALTDCEAWFITFEQLNDLFHSLPEFREFGRSVLVQGFAGLKNRMLTTITETAEERYAQLLQTNPEIFKHATLKNIASYLGVTDTSLSRIRKDFARK